MAHLGAVKREGAKFYAFTAVVPSPEAAENRNQTATCNISRAASAKRSRGYAAVQQQFRAADRRA